MSDIGVVLTSNTVTRPSDTTAYTSGDLVANSTTAGSVTPFTFTDAATRVGQTLDMTAVRLRKSGTSTTNANFRVHFYNDAPGTPSAGDNGAFNTSGTNYIGAFDVTLDRAFTNLAFGRGLPVNAATLKAKVTSSSRTLWALIEARAAYTPASGETFTIDIECALI